MTPTRTPYEALLEEILTHGATKPDRTGTGTLSLFGPQMRFELAEGFPLLTTKKVFTKGVIEELLWFLRGSTNSRELEAVGVNIWREWAADDGELGPVYGHQWRSWGGTDAAGNPHKIDQIRNVIEGLRTDPYGRRHIVSAWNVGELEQMTLPACHAFFQFNVRPGADGVPRFLDCQLYQRSGDFFLGVPFNIASYALLTHMVAAQTGLVAGTFIHTLGDAHLYKNHIEQAKEQLSREPYPWPTLELKLAASIFEYTADHIAISNYRHHPTIKGAVAI